MWMQHSQSVASYAPSESRVIADALRALQTQLQEALDDNKMLSDLAKGMKKKNNAKVKEMKLEISALRSQNKNLHTKLDQTKEALMHSEDAYNEVSESVAVFQSKYEQILK